MTFSGIQTFNTWHSFTEKLKAKVSLRHLSTALSFAGTMRYSEVALKALAGRQDDKYWLRPLKFLAIGKIAISTHEIAKQIKGFSKTPRKIATALTIMSNLSTIGYSTETFVGALSNINLIRSLSWLPLCSVIGAALESATVVSNVREYRETLSLKKLLDEALNLPENANDYTLKDFERGMEFIQQSQVSDNAYISKNFFTDASTLDLYLQKVKSAVCNITSKQTQKTYSTKKQLHATMQDLSKRLDFKLNSHMVSTVAATLDMIAVGLLFSSYWPFSYGLFATAGWMTLGMTAAKSQFSLK